MNNFDSRRVKFLIEHQINPNKLDNLITECGIPHTKYNITIHILLVILFYYLKK